MTTTTTTIACWVAYKVHYVRGHIAHYCRDAILEFRIPQAHTHAYDVCIGGSSSEKEKEFRSNGRIIERMGKWANKQDLWAHKNRHISTDTHTYIHIFTCTHTHEREKCIATPKTAQPYSHCNEWWWGYCTFKWECAWYIYERNKRIFFSLILGFFFFTSLIVLFRDAIFTFYFVLCSTT